MDAEKTGAYLAMLRKARGMTQQDIADQLGVSDKTITNGNPAAASPTSRCCPPWQSCTASPQTTSWLGRR